MYHKFTVLGHITLNFVLTTKLNSTSITNNIKMQLGYYLTSSVRTTFKKFLFYHPYFLIFYSTFHCGISRYSWRVSE